MFNGTTKGVVAVRASSWTAPSKRHPAKGLSGLVLGALLCLAQFAAAPTRAEDEGEGVALVIVYDTSGSMLQKVRDTNGELIPKHVIAKRALTGVLNRLQAIKSSPEGARLPLQVGLVVFQGDRATFAVKFGPYQAAPFRNWLKQNSQLTSGTPLGDAVRVAGEAVLNSKLSRKHVLVITDGINTKGPEPTLTIPRLQQTAQQRDQKMAVHFVAFDVDAEVFSGVKKLGATVLGAADEKQLNAQLEFILEKKILLEEEESPPVQTKTN